MASLRNDTLKKLTGLPPLPNRPAGPSSGSNLARRRRDYSPLSWDKYFESSDDVKVGEKNTFRVYRSGSRGPLLLLLHGGGHSALSWAVCMAAVSRLCHCQVLAFDLRGHGDTRTEDDEDLSADTLCQDVADLVETLYGETRPQILMVGHSMGGAIAVHVAVKNLLPSLIGLAVIDVVEGTALDSLSSMQSFLRGRPQTFETLDKGIEWSVRTGQIHNVESARISMTGQLKRCLKTDVKDNKSSSPTPPPVQQLSDAIPEESEQQPGPSVTRGSGDASSPLSSNECFTWRIDLSKTERFWEGWFSGMSGLFLSCPVPKLLLIAGVDRLDRELTVGQMQGKFQMQVLPQCGHVVHEDAPDRVAEVLVSFLLRLKVVETKESFKRHMPAC